MPRKDNANNPLQIRVRAVSLPKSVSTVRYFQRLLDVIESNGELELPPLWDVRLWWRNPNTKKGKTKLWRSDPFSEAVNESRPGFNDIVAMTVGRALLREKLKAEERQRLKRRKKKPAPKVKPKKKPAKKKRGRR